MPAQPYKPVTWGDEPASKDKMQQMANNEQWLFENAPRVMYDAYGIRKTEGLKILAGRTWIPAANSSSQYVNTYFGSFFASGSSPIVVATPVSRNGLNRYTFSVRGIGMEFPDSRGFQSIITSNEPGTNATRIPVALVLQWIAIGY